jgi:hypothetical protein
MKKLVAALMATAMASTASACPSLNGTWISSHDLTMAFTRAHAKLEERTDHFLDQMMGRLTMRFDGTRVFSNLPDWDAEIAGKPYHLTGFHEASDYQVLFCSDSVIVVKARQPVTGKEVATVYNFVDKDTAWVYQGSADRGAPDLNIREYFVRADRRSN